MARSLKAFKEAFLTLFIGIIGSLGAGFILGGTKDVLAMIPGLAILLPAALGARGTIYGALGSRLSSNLHLGLISHIVWRHPIVQECRTFAHRATLFVSFLIAAITSGLAWFSGIEANPFLLFFISISSGVIAGFILIVLTNAIAFQVFRRGWDPDNVSAPLIATIGDFVTVPILVGIALVGRNLSLFFHFTIFILTGFYILYTLRGYLLTPRFFILAASVSLQLIAGFFLERSLSLVLATPAMLIILPAFLAQGGNLSSLVASRISTQLHLGVLEPEFKIKGRVVNDMLIVALLGILIFPLLGIAAFIMNELLGLPQIALAHTIWTIVAAGFLNTLIVAIVLGFSVSIIAWRLHLNPDDVTIPILSALADLFGILFLLLVI